MNLSWNHCLLSWALKERPKSHCARLGQKRPYAYTDTCTVTIETLPGALTCKKCNSCTKKVVKWCNFFLWENCAISSLQ